MADIVLRGGTVVDGNVRCCIALSLSLDAAALRWESPVNCLDCLETAPTTSTLRSSHRCTRCEQGGEPYVADVAIKDGTISAIGVGLAVTGAREVDCSDRHIMPGWTDVHTHFDAQAMWDPLLAPSGPAGVTTVIAGGRSLFRVKPSVVSCSLPVKWRQSLNYNSAES